MDRRTVAVVLITLVLFSLLPGFVFPFNTDSVRDLFVDLVLFTGYLYASRTLLRFPLALGIGLWHTRRAFACALRHYERLWRIPMKPPEWGFDEAGSSWKGIALCLVVEIVDQHKWRGILAFLDRVWLVITTASATVPEGGQAAMRAGGLAGLLFMILVYVVGGTFSFVLEDALKRASEDQERLIRAAGSHPSFPTVVRARIERDWPDPPG